MLKTIFLMWAVFLFGFLLGCFWGGRARECPPDCEGNVNKGGVL